MLCVCSGFYFLWIENKFSEVASRIVEVNGILLVYAVKASKEALQIALESEYMCRLKGPCLVVVERALTFHLIYS